MTMRVYIVAADSPGRLKPHFANMTVAYIDCGVEVLDADDVLAMDGDELKAAILAAIECATEGPADNVRPLRPSTSASDRNAGDRYAPDLLPMEETDPDAWRRGLPE